MSTPPITAWVPKVSAEPTPAEIHRLFTLAFQKLGNHATAFALQQARINAIQSGTSTTIVESSGGGGGSVVPSTPGGIPVNNQSGQTSYATVSTDDGALIVLSDASAIAVSLTSQSPPWSCFITNQSAIGGGTATLTPMSGTINGVATLALLPAYSVIVAFDGTNWWAFTLPIVPVGNAGAAHEWIASYNAATGIFTLSQPAFADVSGVASTAQIGTGTPSAGKYVDGGTGAWTSIPPSPGFPGEGLINDQSGQTSYVTVPGDNGILLILNDASPVSVTLTTAAAPFYLIVTNFGAGVATLSPSTGTINGGSSLSLLQYQTVYVACDSTNWKTSAVDSASGITQLTGDVTAGPGSGSQPATVVRIQGVGVSATAPTSGQVLKYDGTTWTPENESGGMTNPMTTVGDLIVGGTVSGGVAAPTRLAAGTAGQVLTSNGPGAAPSYQAGGGSAGVASLNSLTGALNLVAGSNVTITPSGSNITIASSGGGGSGGLLMLFPALFGGPVPTIAGTGLTTAYNQAATFSATDQSQGIFLMDTAAISPGGSLEGILKTYPAAPFTLTSVFSTPLGMGTDSIGLIIAASLTGNAIELVLQPGSGGILVANFSSPTSFSSVPASMSIGNAPLLGFRIVDDGTNVTFFVSTDGQFWVQVYTVAKASSWLGSSGFNYIGAKISPAKALATTLLYWNGA